MSNFTQIYLNGLHAGITKTAAKQTGVGHVLSATSGIAPGALVGGRTGEVLSGLIGSDYDTTTGIGALAGAAGGGYVANRLAAEGGPVTRRLLNMLGGGTLGLIGAGVAGEGAPDMPAKEHNALMGLTGVGGGMLGALAPTSKEEEPEEKPEEQIA